MNYGTAADSGYATSTEVRCQIVPLLPSLLPLQFISFSPRTKKLITLQSFIECAERCKLAMEVRDKSRYRQNRFWCILPQKNLWRQKVLELFD